VLGISEYGKGELQSTAFAVFLLLLHNNPILINRLSLSLLIPRPLLSRFPQSFLATLRVDFVICFAKRSVAEVTWVMDMLLSPIRQPAEVDLGHSVALSGRLVRF
jgi:hypothetical protein